MWPYNEQKNLHFGNEQDIHVSSKKYEKNGNNFDLDLITISYVLITCFIS